MCNNKDCPYWIAEKSCPTEDLCGGYKDKEDKD